MKIYKDGSFYNRDLLKEIIMYWHSDYNDVRIQSIITDYDDFIIVYYFYKSEQLIDRSIDEFCHFPVSINVNITDIRDYRINKILK